MLLYGQLEASVDTTNRQPWPGRSGAKRHRQVDCGYLILDPELMAIGFDSLREWTKTNSTLSIFGHYIDELERQKEHIRSDEVEQVSGPGQRTLGGFFRAYNALTNADLKFEDAVAEDGATLEVGQSSVNSLITHQDRSIRKTVLSIMQTAICLQKSLASIQIGQFHRDAFNTATVITLPHWQRL